MEFKILRKERRRRKILLKKPNNREQESLEFKTLRIRRRIFTNPILYYKIPIITKIALEFKIQRKIRRRKIRLTNLIIAKKSMDFKTLRRRRKLRKHNTYQICLTERVV